MVGTRGWSHSYIGILVWVHRFFGILGWCTPTWPCYLLCAKKACAKIALVWSSYCYIVFLGSYAASLSVAELRYAHMSWQLITQCRVWIPVLVAWMLVDGYMMGYRRHLPCQCQKLRLSIVIIWFSFWFLMGTMADALAGCSPFRDCFSISCSDWS